ncbi:TetR/AcrR family transcriptional regulator [Saccharibacillus sacchari]|uniref:TetR/AcrR family transcriptional regulator n=1 Tax=Saccharibacillus sacchari TaxID=456493 RepID=A0ACC6PE35_9BACL
MTKSGRPRAFDKEAVLDAAMDVFWEKGYEACSTEDLCNRTGLGRGSLYNAFGSKHELYEQALDRYHVYWIREQTSILESSEPVKTRLRNFLEWAIEKDFEADSKGCLLINATMERGRTDSTVERASMLHAEKLEKLFGEIIQEGIDSGELSAELSVTESARTFLCSFYGLRTINATMRSRDMAEQIVAGTMRFFN